MFDSVIKSVCVALGMLGLGGCAAVYPEVHTPVRPALSQENLKPAPPRDLMYIHVDGAEIPKRTRDGRAWDDIGGSAPDAFVKVYMGEDLLFKTPVAANSFRPTWPTAQKHNYRIAKSSLRIELWDSNAINHHPICVRTLRNPEPRAGSGAEELVCPNGAIINVTIAPARGQLGLGFSYEYRTESVYVTRVVRASPAARLGIRAGDQIVSLEGRRVKGMDADQVKSAINANSRTGLAMEVKHSDGSTVKLTLKEGPVYREYSEGVALD